MTLLRVLVSLWLIKCIATKEVGRNESVSIHSQLQKIREQLFPFRCHNRLRMKLHSFNFHGAMAQPHNYSILSAGGNFETIRQFRIFDNQRMIAAGAEILFDTCKDCFAIVLHAR